MTSVLLLALGTMNSLAADSRFVGITTSTFDGADGLAAMSAACEADYGAARVCSDADIAMQFRRPRPSSIAWVLFLPVSTVNYNSVGVYWGASGVTAYSSSVTNYAPNCSYLATGYLNHQGPFSSDYEYLDGLVLDTDGELTPDGCNNLHPVACCGPMR